MSHVARLAAAPRLAVLIAGCAAMLAGCAAEQPAPNPAASETRDDRPARAASAASSNDEHDWFVDRADAAGLRFVHFNGMSGQFYFPEIMPPGVGLLDYDNDGDLDVFLVQGDIIGPGKTLSDAVLKAVGTMRVGRRLFSDDVQCVGHVGRTW